MYIPNLVLESKDPVKIPGIPSKHTPEKPDKCRFSLRVVSLLHRWFCNIHKVCPAVNQKFEEQNSIWGLLDMDLELVLGDLIGNVCSCIATNLQIRGFLIRGFIHQRYFPNYTYSDLVEDLLHTSWGTKSNESKAPWA